MMIHACHWKHLLPSDQHGFFLQVVTQSTIARKWKARLYSTEWQIMKQYCSSGGLNTFNNFKYGE